MQPVQLCLGHVAIKQKKQIIAQVPTVHIRPKTTQSGLGILYLHGGGYVVGSSKSHTKLAAQIGHAAQAQVWLPEYRLAPEHTSPAAIEDVITVYKALLAQGQDPKTRDRWRLCWRWPEFKYCNCDTGRRVTVTSSISFTFTLG